jgi:hypothetical protein
MLSIAVGRNIESPPIRVSDEDGNHDFVYVILIFPSS